MIRPLALLSLLALTAPALAGFESGNRLYEDCRAENYFNRGYCAGYVIGIVDAVAGDAATRICIPDGATKGQLTDLVLKYLDDHPERRHHDAGKLVGEVLATAFPCAGPG